MSISVVTMLVPVFEAEQDHVHDAVGHLELGPLVALEDVLDDQRMDAARTGPISSTCSLDGPLRSIQTAASGRFGGARAIP